MQLRKFIPKVIRSPLGNLLLQTRPLRTWMWKAFGASEMLWRRALPSELQFWDNYLRDRNCNWGEDTFQFRIDPEGKLQPHLQNLIEAPAGASVKILDVGAGPLTYIGKQSATHQIEITAVDPLAKDFDLLLERYAIKPPVRTGLAHAEKLTEVFAPETFDLVYARNCLDHAYDLIVAIRQMVIVAKPHSLIVLQHYANEAKKMGYLGLHQWNFEIVDGDLLVNNQVSFNFVSKALVDILQLTQCSETDRLITAVFRKK